MGFNIYLRHTHYNVTRKELARLPDGEPYEKTDITVQHIIYSDGSISRRLNNDHCERVVTPGINGIEKFNDLSSWIIENDGDQPTNDGHNILELFGNYLFPQRQRSYFDEHNILILNPFSILFAGIEAGEDSIQLRLHFRLFHVQMVKKERLKEDEVYISHSILNKAKYCSYIPEDNSQDSSFVYEYSPEVSFLSDTVIACDFSDSKGHFFLTTDGKTEEVKYSAIRPYLKNLNLPKLPGILSCVTSLQRNPNISGAIQLLSRFPMLRIFYKTYGDGMIEILHAFNIFYTKDIPNSFKTYTTPAKSLNTSTSMLKTIAAAHKHGINTSSIVNFDILREKINPQVFESIISKYLDTMRYLEQLDDLRAKSLGQAASTIANIVLDYGGIKGNSYDFARLMHYITDEIYTYQGISSPYEAVQLLYDYYNMMKQMDAKITEWFPKSLKLIHDIAARNHQVVLDKKKEQAFKDAVSSPVYQNLTYADKNWTVLAPSIANDLIVEGRRQSHCVGSYVNYVINRSKCILFMRKTENVDTPVITLDVDPNSMTLTQYRGFDNRAPSEEEMKFIKKWAKKKNLTVYAL